MLWIVARLVHRSSCSHGVSARTRVDNASACGLLVAARLSSAFLSLHVASESARATRSGCARIHSHVARRVRGRRLANVPRARRRPPPARVNEPSPTGYDYVPLPRFEPHDFLASRDDTTRESCRTRYLSLTFVAVLHSAGCRVPLASRFLAIFLFLSLLFLSPPLSSYNASVALEFTCTPMWRARCFRSARAHLLIYYSPRTRMD